MEAPRLGLGWELLLLAYTKAIATPDLSCICDLHHGSQQQWILNPLMEARDWTCILMDTRQIHFCWAMTGNPVDSYLVCRRGGWSIHFSLFYKFVYRGPWVKNSQKFWHQRHGFSTLNSPLLLCKHWLDVLQFNSVLINYLGQHRPHRLRAQSHETSPALDTHSK